MTAETACGSTACTSGRSPDRPTTRVSRAGARCAGDAGENGARQKTTLRHPVRHYSPTGGGSKRSASRCQPGRPARVRSTGPDRMYNQHFTCGQPDRPQTKRRCGTEPLVLEDEAGYAPGPPLGLEAVGPRASRRPGRRPPVERAPARSRSTEVALRERPILIPERTDRRQTPRRASACRLTSCQQGLRRDGADLHTDHKRKSDWRVSDRSPSSAVRSVVAEVAPRHRSPASCRVIGPAHRQP